MSFRKHALGVTVMNLADVVQPLLLLPYAGRVLGADGFGQFAYALSIATLALVIVGYGFHWTAQREAASARDDPAVLGALYADVATTRTVLFLAVILVGLALADGPLPMSRGLFLCTMLTSAGHILLPTWVLLALERAWQGAIAVAGARILALVCFVFVVRSPEQVELAVGIQASVPLVAAAISLPFVLPVIGADGFRSMTISRIAGRLRRGWRGFLYTAVEGGVGNLAVPLVAHFSNYIVAGQYSVAEKFVSVNRPFSRAMTEIFLPRLAYYADRDPTAAVDLVWRSLLTLIGSATFSLTLFTVAPYAILLIFGNQFAGAVPIIRLMSILPVLVNINIVTSNLYMFSCGHERAWAYLHLLSLGVFLGAAYLLSSAVANAAIAVVFAVIAREAIVLVVSGVFFLRFGIGRTGFPQHRERVAGIDG